MKKRFLFVLIILSLGNVSFASDTNGHPSTLLVSFADSTQSSDSIFSGTSEQTIVPVLDSTAISDIKVVKTFFEKQNTWIILLSILCAIILILNALTVYFLLSPKIRLFFKEKKEQKTELKKALDENKQLKDEIAILKDTINSSNDMHNSIVEKYQRLETYQKYFINIAKSAKTAFYELPKHNDNEKENTRTLLFYLSQLYSIAAIMQKAYDPDKVKLSFTDEELSSLKDNIDPYIKKEATINDFKGKGTEFRYIGASGEDALIEYLKKNSPLDFNLLGKNYTKFLN